MRLLFAASVVWSCLLNAAVSEEVTFPYKAYVTSSEVYVRSGPGKNYYPTSKLEAGAEVEVYRHDPGGWYAIRPPEGNFTWLSGRYLESAQDGLAKVTAEEVAARVGSQFSEIRDVIQVRLHKGETVEVLDKKQFGSGPEAGVWYKIAPPSGEFRWVFGKYVDPDFPKDGLRKSSAENNPLLHPTVASSQVAPADAQEKPAVKAATAEQTATTRQVWDPSPAAKAEPSVAVALAAESGTAVQPPPALATREFHDPQDPQAAQKPTRQLSPEEFQEEVDKLEMALSVMLVEEPTVWNFEELGLKAKNLLLQAETAVERGRVRAVLTKITQSDDIRQRYDTVAKLRTDTERENRELAELSQRRAAAVSTASQDAGRFDGTGRLARVVSPKVGAPQYALVDDRGSVQCYVTPAPGVNMQYYLGKRIGINGVRGYITDQKAEHVMAKHVTTLDGTVVR
jgi:uncharacterized protein YgiM (DUF1202 family)